MRRVDTSTRNFVYGLGTGVILLSMATGYSGVAFVAATLGTAFEWYDQKLDQDVVRFLGRYVKF